MGGLSSRISSPLALSSLLLLLYKTNANMRAHAQRAQGETNGPVHKFAHTQLLINKSEEKKKHRFNYKGTLQLFLTFNIEKKIVMCAIIHQHYIQA